MVCEGRLVLRISQFQKSGVIDSQLPFAFQASLSSNLCRCIDARFYNDRYQHSDGGRNRQQCSNLESQDGANSSGRQNGKEILVLRLQVETNSQKLSNKLKRDSVACSLCRRNRQCKVGSYFHSWKQFGLLRTNRMGSAQPHLRLQLDSCLNFVVPSATATTF